MESPPSDRYSTPMYSNNNNKVKDTATATMKPQLGDIFVVPYKNIDWPATILSVDDFMQQQQQQQQSNGNLSEDFKRQIMYCRMTRFLGGKEMQVATLLGYNSTENAPKILVPIVGEESCLFNNLTNAISQLETPTRFNKDKSLFMAFAGAMDELYSSVLERPQDSASAELSSCVDKAQETWMEAYGTSEDSRDNRVSTSETPTSTLAVQVSLSDCSKDGGPATPKHSNSSNHASSSFVTPMNVGRTHTVVTDLDCTKKSVTAENQDSATIINKEASLVDHGIKPRDSFKVAVKKLQECGWGVTSRKGKQLWLAPGTYIELATRGVNLLSELELREHLSKKFGWRRPMTSTKKSKKAVSAFVVKRQSSRARKEAVPPGQPAVECLKKKKAVEPDKFYRFVNLIRFLQEERGWRYIPSSKGLHNWVYVRSANTPEAKGKHLIDYFYTEEEVIDYAKANDFKQMREKTRPTLVTPPRN